MAATGLNEFYEARRKEARFQERAAVSSYSNISKPCGSCNKWGCSSSCARYHAHSYGTPYTNAYRSNNTSYSSRNVQTNPSPHRGFSCELHPQKRSDRIHDYDRMMTQVDKSGVRYVTGVLPKRFNNNDYVSQH